MRLFVGLAVCFICGPLPALAGDEPTPKVTPAQATPTKPQDLTAEEKRLLSGGYRLQVKNGQKIFCRREAQLGSHFEKKVCGTAEQLATITRDSRDALDNTLRPGGNPTPSAAQEVGHH